MKRNIILTAAVLLLLTAPIWADTLTVTNCADSGAGSLRQAITDISSNGDEIIFDITTTEAGYSTGEDSPGLVTDEAGSNQWFRIIINSDLPQITNNYIAIKGSTQTHEAANTLGPSVEVRANNALISSIFNATGNYVTIEGLALNRLVNNAGSGIILDGSDNSHIHGCYIGTTASGEAKLSTNFVYGITIQGIASNNIIGGTSEAERNVISGNTNSGIFVNGPDSNDILGNYIGIASNGSSLLGNNANGIILSSGAKYNKIGNGTSVGRNVISGNGSSGVAISGSGTDGNEIFGNFIGTQADGISARPNFTSGVLISSSAQNNRIGSSESTGQRNIISGHAGGGDYGIGINSASNNYIEGNWIGLGTDESTVANYYGIGMTNSSQSNYIISNVISGNDESGIMLSNSSSNKIFGNFIGFTSSGEAVMANDFYGIVLYSNSQYNLIGTSESGGRNLIVGHSDGNDSGIYFSGANVKNNYIYNNIIGLTSSEAIPSSRGKYGIRFAYDANHNQIGGTGAGEGNIISGNSEHGIYFNDSSTNEIFGNFIGFKSDGETVRTNGVFGIYLFTNSQNNLIGTSESGGGNLIVGDSNGSGIGFNGSDVKNNHIYNNIIGLTSSEAIPSSRGRYGISSTNYANNNHIGGTAAGEGNIISGNSDYGIYFYNSSTNEIFGNFIGLAADGEELRTNRLSGINLGGSSQDNLIGTSESGGGNVIVASSEGVSSCIHFYEQDVKNNYIYNNIIGLTSSEAMPSFRGKYGIYFENDTNNNHIGGRDSGEKNIISGNLEYGIYFNASSTNEIFGNYIGFASNGETVRANTHGIHIFGASRDNLIGTSESGGGNLIVGSSEASGYGIVLNGSGVQSNYISNNTIGLTSSEGTPSPKGYYGIYLYNGASYNRIGPSNTIAFNIADGVRVDGSSTTQEVITQNSIFSNSGKGIELINSGNGEVASPEISSAGYNEITTQTQITGTGAPANGTVEIFKAEGGQGKTYLGSTTADGSGNWNITVSGLISGDAVVATGTTANPQTSEFSSAEVVATSVAKQYQPDNMIATLESGTDYVGDGIYNTTGANQTRTRSISTGGSATYYIKIENDGNTTDEVIVTGTGSSGDWTVTYYNDKTGGSDITSQVIGSGWSTGNLTSGESKEIRMVAQNNGTALVTLEALITSTSNNDSSGKDAVKASTTFLPTDLSSFDVSTPATTTQNSAFSMTITARDSVGSIETSVIGITQLSVDAGTISPESIAESAFTDGVWTGDVILSKIGARTVTVSNEGVIGTAQIVVMNPTIEITSDGVTITIPAGAASEEVSISAAVVTDPPANPPPGYYIGGSMINITGSPTEFLLPVTVTIPINGPLTVPRVYYWNGSNWSSDGIVIISYTETSLTFTTTHISIFAPMAALSSNLVRFGPNPYNPNSGTTAKIWYWLNADAETSIYIVDISGTLVWKETYAAGTNGGKKDENSIDFDGKDRWGNILGDGVYIYKIVQNGKSIGGGKIAIIK